MTKWTDLEAEAPEGWFSQYDIEVLVPEVENIPAGGTYLEIGVHKGRSLWVARQVARPTVQVWGVDVAPNPHIPNTHFVRTTEDSSTLPEQLRGLLVDVLFIDADHSYEGCKKDILMYYKLIKPGGAILFHDCDETSPGVVRAVNEAAKSIGKKVQSFKVPGKNTSVAKVQL